MKVLKSILISSLIVLCRSCEDSNDSNDSEEPVIDMSKNEDSEPTKSISITNSCSFDIDVGFTGGFTGIATDGECNTHQVNDGTNRCFWDLDLQSKAMRPGESIIKDLQVQDGLDVVVSGAIFGLRSPFMNDSCPGGECKPFQGPTGTVTLAEFTILTEGITYYDVSNIHGGAIPTSMGPTEPSMDNDPYREGIAGDCSWTFEPPSDYDMYLIEVKNGHGSCSNHDDCDQHEVCGTLLGGSEPVHGTCGEFYGYINAHSNCIAGSVGYPFFCETYSDLYACAGMYIESGYSNIQGGPSICGCSDYEDLDIISSFPCVNSNPVWIEKAYKWIHYIKKGCPNAYGFQFDDSTSTFTSKLDDFSIVFCPGDSEYNFFI